MRELPARDPAPQDTVFRLAPEWGLMHTILRLLLSLGLFAVGLVAAVTVLAASLLLVALWGARALWMKLTGRPVAPFAMRFGARDAFRRTWRTRPGAADVIDVEARRVS